MKSVTHLYKTKAKKEKTEKSLQYSARATDELIPCQEDEAHLMRSIHIYHIESRSGAAGHQRR